MTKKARDLFRSYPVLIGVWLAAIVLLFSTGCSGSEPAGEDGQSKAETQEVSETQTQDVTKDGLTVTVPSDWEVDETDEEMTHIFVGDDGLLQLQSVAEYSRADGASSDEIYQTLAESMSSAGAVVQDDVEKFSIGKALAYRTEASLPDNGYSGWLEVVLSGNRMHLVMFMVPDDKLDKRSEEMLAILDGITLEKDEAPILDGADGESKQEFTGDVQTVYHVGDELDDGGLRIVYAASGEHIEDSEYLKPDEGFKYVFIKLAFINETDRDASVSMYSFNAYADGYAADMYYGGDDTLSATLSAGRSTEGYLYFEVPTDAEEIEVEYTTNYFTSDKITFAYDGDKDSGFKLEPSAERTNGAVKVGETVQGNDVSITYLSCEPYESDNMFIKPRDGYEYLSVELEFENTGNSDRSVSSMSFDCYADGVACEQTYSRDNDLSATISAGRKTKGTVTFEVPSNASVVEVEYDDSVWTSNRIVFSAR